MLTDYHVHLRPDDLEATPAAEYFTAENAARYREAADQAGIEELGASEHIHRFADALQIWDHPFWREQARDDLTAYCEFVRSTDLRLGIEMDFVPGREDRIANLLAAHDFDYVVGSVHFVGDGAVDNPDNDVWRSGVDPDRLWQRYFEMIGEAARSGLFDILAHPDLIKYWGGSRPEPTRDPRFHYEPAVEAISDAGVAVEVSTAGLRKPIREIYPAPAFAEMCVDAGAVFALSSDAHEPENVGHEYERAVEEMRGWGVSQLAVFERRGRRLVDLG
jgi:histidinol-phosphatase (PHP family)